jgi:hypothetical protein
MLLHVYWALGGHWPGRDLKSMVDTVVGAPVSAAPGPVACALVAILLGLAGALVVGTVVVDSVVVDVGAIGVAVVFLLRGLIGFVDVRLRPSTKGSRFARLNVVLYSPLCLALGTLALIAVVGR